MRHAASSARQVRRRLRSAVASAQARSRHSRAIGKQQPSPDGPPQSGGAVAEVAVIGGAATQCQARGALGWRLQLDPV
jgi:hypothetical protein